MKLRSIGGAEVTTIEGYADTAVKIGPFGEIRGFTITGGNSAFGGAMAVSGLGTLVDSNIFERNSGNSGSAIWGNEASPTVTRNVFRYNCPTASVVAFVNSSHPTIANNIFENNEDIYDYNSCAAIAITQPSSAPQYLIANNTFVNNEVAIDVHTAAWTDSMFITNNLFVNNDAAVDVSISGNTALPLLSDNLVHGNTADYTGVLPDQTGTNGNISADPLFVDSLAGDYRLLIGSPAIDAGSDVVLGAPYSLATDFAGNSRLFVAHVDIGAFESLPVLIGTLQLQGVEGMNAFELIGPVINASGPNGVLPPIQVMSNGVFLVQLAPGVYSLSADALGFVSRTIAGVNVTNSGAQLSGTTLRIGDADRDGDVDSDDAVVVALGFPTGPVTNSRLDQSRNVVDIDGSGEVTARDISLFLSNIGLNGPQDWDEPGINPPVALGDSYTAILPAADTAPAQPALLIASSVAGILSNDIDPDGDTLTAILVSDVSHGSLQLFEDGSFNYTSDLGFTGDDQFMYVASDGSNESQPATVVITIEPENADGPHPTPTASPTPTNTPTPTQVPTATPTLGPTPVIDLGPIVDIPFNDCYDLETGLKSDPSFPQSCSADDDFSFAFNSNNTPHAVIFQNQSQGVEIAYSDETFEDVDAADITGLSFTSSLVDTPFTKVAVLKTIESNYYKLGFISEDANNLTVTFRRGLISEVEFPTPTATLVTSPTATSTSIPTPTSTPSPQQTPTATGTEETYVFWADQLANKIQRFNEDSPAVEDIVTVGREFPNGIAVAPSIGKVHWGDEQKQNIRRANFDGFCPCPEV